MRAESQPPFQVDYDGGRARLALFGRVTVAHARELHAAAVALAAGAGDVTLDCRDAEYLDTAAVQVLIALRRDMERAGRGCEVAGESAALRGDFRLAGFASGGR